MCLPNFTKFHHCLFKILKNQNVANGQTHRHFGGGGGYKYWSAIFPWGIHIWSFKTLACTVHKIWHESKSVTDACTDRQPKSNMLPQLLWSWGHNNNKYLSIHFRGLWGVFIPTFTTRSWGNIFWYRQGRATVSLPASTCKGFWFKPSW